MYCKPSRTHLCFFPHAPSCTSQGKRDHAYVTPMLESTHVLQTIAHASLLFRRTSTSTQVCTHATSLHCTQAYLIPVRAKKKTTTFFFAPVSPTHPPDPPSSMLKPRVTNFGILGRFFRTAKSGSERPATLKSGGRGGRRRRCKPRRGRFFRSHRTLYQKKRWLD